MERKYWKDFILGGAAVFTLQSARTQVRYTYRIWEPKALSRDGARYLYAGLLTGPDNTSNYQYLGFIRVASDTLPSGTPVYKHSPKSRIDSTAPSVIALKWFLARVLADAEITPDLLFYPSGRCGKCGKMLTDPVSIETGFGPICAGRAA